MILSLDLEPSSIWNGIEDSLFLRICKSLYLLEIGQANEALSLIQFEKNPPLEVYLIKARLLALKGNHLEALHLLKSIREEAKSDLRFYQQLLQHQIDARDGSDIKKHAVKL